MILRRVAAVMTSFICAVSAFASETATAQASPPAARAIPADYEAAIAKARPMVGKPGSHDQAMEQLGELSVRAANDLELALALGDARTAAELDRLIREKLGDTRWRVEQDAVAGDADALLAIGIFSARNLLAARNMEKACEAFVKAAEREHVAGTYQAALCRLKTDPERAAAWMQRAAEAGHPAAREAVGRACLERKPEPQFECAVRYVSEAAQAGRPSAQSLLGWMYANGAGVPKDASRASRLYLEAARKQDVAAQNNLGELYEKGLGVAKNERLAAGWYLQAAQAGFAPAQFNLGRLYALGAEVDRNPAQARLWLEKAKAQGIDRADEVLRWLALQGRDGSRR